MADVLSNMKTRWHLFLRLRREIGTVSTLLFALKRKLGLAPRESEPPLPARKNTVVDFYSFVLERPFGDGEAPGMETRSINWVIPDFNVGSGGHTTIFRLIYYLERFGFHSRIIIDGPCHFPNAGSARNCVREHFFPLQAAVTIGRDSMRPAWITFATGWTTAYTVRDFRPTRIKCYLIQDFEPGFYAWGSEYAFAENTYRMGFAGITAGDWLARLAGSRYGMQARPFGFGVDRDIYHPYAGKRDASQKKVFCYARPVTQRRGFELGLLALKVLNDRLPGVHVVFAGWKLSDYEIPFKHTDLGTVSPTALAAAIAGSDVALVISLSNLSLLPLEVMACGCPVVSNNGPHVEWGLKHEVNALLAEAVPEALAGGLERVLSDRVLREGLVARGLEEARAADWEREARKVESYLLQLGRGGYEE